MEAEAEAESCVVLATRSLRTSTAAASSPRQGAPVRAPGPNEVNLKTSVARSPCSGSSWLRVGGPTPGELAAGNERHPDFYFIDDLFL